MKYQAKVFLLAIIFLGLFGVVKNSQATLLIDEPFSGPCSTNSESGVQTNFVSSIFSNVSGVSGCANSGSDGHYVVKDTTVRRGTSGASLKLYPNKSDQTSELWSSHFALQDEVWISWWEFLSSDFSICQYNKWFLIQMDQSSTDPYVTWQTTAETQQKGFVNIADVEARNMGLSPETVIQVNTTFPAAQWFQVKIHLKLNTPGQSNGTFKIWKNQGSGWEKISAPERWHYNPTDDEGGLNIRGNTSWKIYSIRLGGTRTGYPGYGSRWIDDVKVGTAEADVDSASTPVCPDGSCNGTETCTSCPQDCGTCPDPTPPAAPSGLVVQ